MSIQHSSSARLQGFFLELVRKSFSQLGVGDRQIIGYIAGILSDFSHADRWLRLRNAEGKRLTSTVEMLLMETTAELSAGERVVAERAVRKYVGDYTLFMSGLFRRFVEHAGYLGYYFEEGARAYRAVSALDVSLYRPGFLIFEELGRSFESYSGALDFMRKCYFAPAPNEDPFAGFFRQIAGWKQYALSNN
jgi:hypothetical protein